MRVMSTFFLIPYLFPQPCLLCGAPCLFETIETVAGSGSIPLCDRCHRSVALLDGRRCGRCSQLLTSERATCLRCRAREFAFESNWSLFAYEGTVRELLYQYKFRNHERLARYFAWWLARAYEVRFAGLPLVPVPFRPSGRRKRGWDHIESILRVLERSHHIPALRILQRGEGRQQKALDYEGRMRNLHGRIRLRGSTKTSALHRAVPLPKAAVLLDDVFTTGATASECSRVLREAGVERVSVLTIAID